jgi:hypothetical protein
VPKNKTLRATQVWHQVNGTFPNLMKSIPNLEYHVWFWFDIRFGYKLNVKIGGPLAKGCVPWVGLALGMAFPWVKVLPSNCQVVALGMGVLPENSMAVKWLGNTCSSGISS